MTRPPPASRGAILVPIWLLWAALAHAAEVEVSDGWARASAGAGGVAAAYLTLTNRGGETALTGVETPLAGHAGLHATSEEGGVMRMRMVDRIPLAPGASVTLQPGGLHVMLMGLAEPLVEGDRLALTLIFEDGGRIDTEVPVLAPGASGSEAHGAH